MKPNSVNGSYLLPVNVPNPPLFDHFKPLQEKPPTKLTINMKVETLTYEEFKNFNEFWVK